MLKPRANAKKDAPERETLPESLLTIPFTVEAALEFLRAERDPRAEVPGWRRGALALAIYARGGVAHPVVAAKRLLGPREAVALDRARWRETRERLKAAVPESMHTPEELVALYSGINALIDALPTPEGV